MATHAPILMREFRADPRGFVEAARVGADRAGAASCFEARFARASG